MEKVPFFRRTLAILVVGLTAAGLPYLLLFLRATPLTTPGSLLRLVPLLGMLVAAGAFVLSLRLIQQTADNRSSLLLMLRAMLIAAWLLAHLAYTSSAAMYAVVRVLLFDLDLLILSLMLSLTLAAQFVLPVESGRARLLAVRRLLGYALGERGPVTFVEEGVARQAYAEDRRPGPGVFFIDNASAVVLRTDTTFTRAVGPGVVFTRPGERCAEALDLRRQIRHIHADSGSQNQPSEAEVSTEAITQDGIAISAEISISFILDPGHEGTPREGRLADKPPYEFNRTSVERAVYAHTFGEFGDVSWTQIPALLVADAWREEIKQWSLSALLNSGSGQQGVLTQIRDALQARLIPPSRKDFQGAGSPARELSREMEILSARGIRLLEIGVSDLKLPMPILKERSLHWHEEWSGDVQAALREALEEVRTAREAGERRAEHALGLQLGQSLIELLQVGKKPGQRDTLLSFINDALEFTLPESTSGVDPHLRVKLAGLRDTLGDLPGDCQGTGDQVQ